MAKGIRSGQTRASGETTAEEIAQEETEKLDETIEPQLPQEREKIFRTPGFSRMRIDWTREDRLVVARAQDAVDKRIISNFKDAYQVMHEIYDLVRTPEVDPKTGEVLTDNFGFKKWQRTPSGSYEEDWSRLTLKERENFMFTITTRMFEWTQRAADSWGEAMFAKAAWTERFSIGFDAPVAGTVDDRKARGNLDAREEHYLAIFLTLYSKKAEGLVRTMELLGQRLKDSLT